MSEPADFGCVITATGIVRDPERAQLVDEHLDTLIAVTALLGAAPIVVVHDGTVRVAAPARGFAMPRAGRDDLSALRVGLMQLTNSAVGAALIVPIEMHDVSVALLKQMIGDARSRRVGLVAVDRRGSWGFPLFATRDSWRELMTTEGTLEAVLRLLGPRLLAIEGEE